MIKKLLALIVCLNLSGLVEATTKFMDSADAVQDATTFYVVSAGAVSAATDQKHNGPRSYKFASGAGPTLARLVTLGTVYAEAVLQGISDMTPLRPQQARSMPHRHPVAALCSVSGLTRTGLSGSSQRERQPLMAPQSFLQIRGIESATPITSPTQLLGKSSSI